MLEKVAILIIALIVMILMYAVWDDSNSEKIELKKSDWHCTKTELRTSTTLVGKVTVPQITQHCIQYEKK